MLYAYLLRYPFDMNNSWVFFFVYIFQLYAGVIGVAYNSSIDTLGPAFIMHANSQVKRLGIQWTKVKL